MSAWSNIEVELIVADYFSMLQLELQLEPYSKAKHRRGLMPLLTNRSEGSIEFKHQNISAALIQLGRPYIKGYLPRFNIQRLLYECVVDYLVTHPELEVLFQNFAEGKTVYSNDVNFDKWIVDAPKLSVKENMNLTAEPDLLYTRNPLKINYLEREQRNTELGMIGEENVLKYEQWFLRNLGKHQLADQIEWISKIDDGAGFDILSFTPEGSEKFIEVKTTKLGKETPFYFTKNELNFSIRNSSDYHLYRLFNAEAGLKMFTQSGSLETICHSEAVSFKGWF